MIKKFYTVKEIADMLQINAMTVYRYIKKGRIRVHRIGKDLRVEEEELKIFLDSIKTKRNTPIS